MNIALIGDYASPNYQEFLKKIKMVKPEEIILDLSRHPGYNWGKKLKARFEDISASHMVIIHPDYRDSIDSRRDVTYAMDKKRECMIYVDGVFRPFAEYAPTI